MDKITVLSKEISYALRHAPWEYELEMDEEGWVPVKQLLDALHKDKKWKQIFEQDLSVMIERSEKKRHEMRDGKIRAFYGHSIPMRIAKEEKTPPEKLYHGTAGRFLTSIKENGLLPQGRQYVHLSQDMETAYCVGKRHDSNPCILLVDAAQAWNDGIRFYYGNEKVWLADVVPGKYLSLMKNEIKI
ncbi:MAG: RNA 2'-phosphotransferase [Eubacterium sp.]|nr:RNA 2'-phosphotransferase [Eubacterium sp.]